MDIHAVRLENLRRLMRERFSNRQASLARAAGLAPGYVSFLFTGRKRLGEGLARRIEQRLGLAGGSLDQPQSGAVEVRERPPADWRGGFRTRRLITRLVEAESSGALDNGDVAALEAILNRLVKKSKLSA